MINSKSLTFSLFFLLLLFTHNSCKKSSVEQDILDHDLQTKTVDQSITKADIENLKYTDYVLSETSYKAITDWSKFFEIEAQLDLIKNGDLSFFNDNNTALVGLLEDFKNEIPSDLNDTTITVRLKVIESLFYRLEDILNYSTSKQEMLDMIRGILIANSNLIDQINKKIEKDQQKITSPY